MTDHDHGNTPTNRKAETRRKHSETLSSSAQASPGSFKTVVDLALSLSRDWDEERTRKDFDGLVTSLQLLCTSAKETSIRKQRQLSDASRKQHLKNSESGTESEHSQQRLKRPPNIVIPADLEGSRSHHMLRPQSAASDDGEGRVKTLKSSLSQNLRKSIIKQSKTQLIVTFLIILFNVHPDIAENGFVLLACEPFYGDVRVFGCTFTNLQWSRVALCVSLLFVFCSNRCNRHVCCVHVVRKALGS